MSRVFPNPSLPPRSRLAIALHIVLLGSVAQPLAQVSAAPLSVQRSFDVPASNTANTRFMRCRARGEFSQRAEPAPSNAQQANISLPYDPALVQDKQAPAVVGKMPAEQAMNRHCRAAACNCE